MQATSEDDDDDILFCVRRWRRRHRIRWENNRRVHVRLALQTGSGYVGRPASSAVA